MKKYQMNIDDLHLVFIDLEKTHVLQYLEIFSFHACHNIFVVIFHCIADIIMNEKF
jgi:hypothetical protein